MFKPSSSWSTSFRQVLNLGVFNRRNWQPARSFSRRPPPPPPRDRRILDSRVLLAFTSAAGFSFKDHGIQDERMKQSEDVREEFDKRDERKHGWEALVDEKDFRAFRRRVEGPFEMYEYKCAGTYYDISPRTFLDAQNDLKYRKEWDGNIITLELLREQGEHELIRWVSKYPYPMYPREYVYARRTWVSDDNQVVIVDSEVVPESVWPSPDNKNVRVATYTSRMAVRAHGSWNEHGLDYILTYSDNPEANIPRYIYNWIVNQGGPYFLKQVHVAAIHIEKTGKQIRSTIEKALAARGRRDDRRTAKEVDRLERTRLADEARAAEEEQKRDQPAASKTTAEKVMQTEEKLPPNQLSL